MNRIRSIGKPIIPQTMRTRRTAPAPIGRGVTRNKLSVIMPKTNYMDQLKSATTISTKQIRQRSPSSYKMKPVVKPKPSTVQIQPRRAKIRVPTNRVQSHGNMIRQEVRKPRKNISSGAYEQYSGKISSLRDIGKGKFLIMLACGPSVLESPLELLLDRPEIDFMSINRPYGFYKNQVPEAHAPIWPTRYWSFCDHSQFRRNQQAWESYKKTIINSPAVRTKHPNQIIIRHKPGKGFSKDLAAGYYIGRSTTYASMQVAYWMNYDKIFILGLDMTSIDGKLHHYGKNPDVADENRMKRFQSEAEYYKHAAQILTPGERAKFIMCSSYNPFDFMASFGRLDQKEVPDVILKELNQK